MLEVIGNWTGTRSSVYIEFDSVGCVIEYQTDNKTLNSRNTYQSDCKTATTYIPINHILNDTSELNKYVDPNSFGTIISSKVDSSKTYVFRTYGRSNLIEFTTYTNPDDYLKFPTPLSNIKDKRIDAETHMRECYDSFNNIIQFGEFRDGYLYTGRQYNYDKFGLLDSIDTYKNGKYQGRAIVEQPTTFSFPTN